MRAPEGFEWAERKDGSVAITHHGTVASVLRGRRAQDFIEDVEAVGDGGDQELMARITGNYKHGNERTAKNHPRNRR
ncbi:hypothetical protein N802_07665 [Knoellia sinensis KCTC 19936]|uniref:Uncharacterized protein n=1 Tax=Knoellia sinensis KCTC 19936 TaxID=1385520 RepID=A0A0A0JCE6_9MICO|nr:hypothetical protein [Knoellia sinensis]KGN33687.1 hypothetical protein N802_07665 [Knoellia sinensis KCTC 19936]